MTASESDYTLVDSPAALAELGRVLDGAPSHALDSEANSGFAYRERLCLLQLNVGGRLWLVDLEALPPGPERLEPLRTALESDRQPTCLHGGEYDVGLLKRDYGIAPAAIRDSQQAASLLDWPQTGYGRLVERICGVTLPKGHAFYDWSRRPLADEPLRYALDDVRYLPRVCERVVEELRTADLEEEFEIACEAVAAATWNGGFSLDGVWRIKGVRKLDDSRMPLLVALYAWRDAVARRADRPPGRLINNALLLAVARAAPRRPGELRRLGLRGRQLERYGGEIARLVRDAARQPPAVPPRPAGRRPPPAVRRRGRELRAWRRREAERRGVSQQAVLPGSALRHLEQHGAGDLRSVPQLGGKRIALYGERLAELCGGG